MSLLALSFFLAFIWIAVEVCFFYWWGVLIWAVTWIYLRIRGFRETFHPIAKPQNGFWWVSKSQVSWSFDGFMSSLSKGKKLTWFLFWSVLPHQFLSQSLVVVLSLSLEALNALRQDLKIFKKQFVGVSVIPTFRNIRRCMVSNKSRVLKNECALQWLDLVNGPSATVEI